MYLLHLIGLMGCQQCHYKYKVKLARRNGSSPQQLLTYQLLLQTDSHGYAIQSQLHPYSQGQEHHIIYCGSQRQDPPGEDVAFRSV
jgi:hypothetical protein